MNAERFERIFSNIIQKHGDHLDMKALVCQLYIHRIIMFGEYNTLKAVQHPHDQQIELVKRLATKDIQNVMDGLHKVFTVLNWEGPLETFQQGLAESSVPEQSLPSTRESPQPEIAQLNAEYKLRCEVMKKQWRSFLDFPDEFGMEKLYTQLYLVNPNQIDKEAPIEETKIFEDLSNRANVLIVGHGGTGKTTFVNKCVLDWATDNGQFPWPKTFDYIILVAGSEIKEMTDEDFDIEKLILSSLRAINLQEFAREIMQIIRIPKHQMKTLIILDGLDDIRIQRRNDFIDHLFRSRKLSSATLLATTRPGYFENWPSSIATVFDEDKQIRINGFSVEQRKEYFGKWQEKKGGEKIKEPHHSLEKLLEVPLFSALYCSFNIQKETVSLFQLVNGAVENMMDRYKKNRNPEFSETQRKELEEYLGCLAMQRLRPDPGFSAEENTEILLMGHDIGILWPAHKTGEKLSSTTADVGFPHQIFLDFFAAKHFLSRGNTYKDAVGFEEVYFKYFLTGLQPNSAEECFKLWFQYCEEYCEFQINWFAYPQHSFTLPRKPETCKQLHFFNRCYLDQSCCDVIWQQTIPNMKKESWFDNILGLVLKGINSCGILYSTDLFKTTSLFSLEMNDCTIPELDCKYLASYFLTTQTLQYLEIHGCEYDSEATVTEAIANNSSLTSLRYAGKIKTLVHSFLQVESKNKVSDLSLSSWDKGEQTEEFIVCECWKNACKI